MAGHALGPSMAIKRNAQIYSGIALTMMKMLRVSHTSVAQHHRRIALGWRPLGRNGSGEETLRDAMEAAEQARQAERERRRNKAEGNTVASFYGLKIVSDRICFVLDGDRVFITSASGAALQDMLKVLHRFSNLEVIVAPAMVQGEEAGLLAALPP